MELRVSRPEDLGLLRRRLFLSCRMLVPVGTLAPVGKMLREKRDVNG